MKEEFFPAYEFFKDIFTLILYETMGHIIDNVSSLSIN